MQGKAKLSLDSAAYEKARDIRRNRPGLNCQMH